jgi:hypothetical protein
VIAALSPKKTRKLWHKRQAGKCRLFEYNYLYTDDFKRDYQNLKDNQIKIVREPSFEAYGTVAVFEDIYGNLWDLIEPNQ